MGRHYYDIRYPLLLAIAFLQSYVDDEQTTSTSSISFAINEVKMVIFLMLLAAFLLTTVRIQVFWCFSSQQQEEEDVEQQQQQQQELIHSRRRIEIRFGKPALSVPLTLSLIITLFLPPSTLWISAYLLIFLMSFWSDAIHSFFTNFSYGQDRVLLLPLVLTHDMNPPSQHHNTMPAALQLVTFGMNPRVHSR